MFDHFQRNTLPRWTDLLLTLLIDLLVRVDQTEKHEGVINILWGGARIVTWSFSQILFKIWSKPSVLEVNILCCNAL